MFASGHMIWKENVFMWNISDHNIGHVAKRYQTFLRKENIGVTGKERTEWSVSTIFANYLEFGTLDILSVYIWFDIYVPPDICTSLKTYTPTGPTYKGSIKRQ